MPEYLAPGVYIEEISFAGKPLDGVGLSPDIASQLDALSHHVVQAKKVFQEDIPTQPCLERSGVKVSFTGPDGTGKNLAAKVLANQTGANLYIVDLSSVMSKYIGETEKNLNHIFVKAEGSNAILFFDEADALFGKQTDIKDARDRYANIETNYLLARLEDYKGVVILATNMEETIDQAFIRRMDFVISFPKPDSKKRMSKRK